MPGDGKVKIGKTRWAVKTLYLLRHAKSDGTDWTGQDFERPLNERGELACTTMAAHLREHGILPGVVLCSTAVRARATLTGIAAELDWPGADDRPPFDFRDEIYLASETELLAQVRGLEDGIASAMVIGHNPGIEVLAISLARRGVRGKVRGRTGGQAGGKAGDDRDAFEALERKFPTAALATLTFDLDRWRDLGPGEGRLAGFVKPSTLSETT